MDWFLIVTGVLLVTLVYVYLLATAVSSAYFNVKREHNRRVLDELSKEECKHADQ